MWRGRPCPRVSLTFDPGGPRPAIDAAAGAEAVVRGPEGDVYALGKVDADTFQIYFPGLARFDFRPPSWRVRAISSRVAADELVVDLFRTTVRPIVLQIAGFEVLHASAVRHREAVLAFCGTSGTGKSTVAHGLSQRDWTHWSDDAVVFETGAASDVRCFQLPYAVRLRDPTREFFAAPDGDVAAVEDGDEDSPRALAAITVLERQAVSGHEIRRLDSGEALRAVLPHAFRFTLEDQHRRRRTIESYIDLVSRVPVLLGRFSPGFARLPAFLDELEEALREFRN